MKWPPTLPTLRFSGTVQCSGNFVRYASTSVQMRLFCTLQIVIIPFLRRKPNYTPFRKISRFHGHNFLPDKKKMSCSKSETTAVDKSRCCFTCGICL